MKRIAVVLIMAVPLLWPRRRRAQHQWVALHAAGPVRLPTTLDELIKAVDDAVSGHGEQDRTCFRALFTADARLTPIRVAANGIGGTAHSQVRNGSTRWPNVARVLLRAPDQSAHGDMGTLAHLWRTYTTARRRTESR